MSGTPAGPAAVTRSRSNWLRWTAVVALASATVIGIKPSTGAASAPFTGATVAAGGISQSVVPVAAESGRRAASNAADPRWNIVIVLTDDQNAGMTGDMPHLRDLITETGTTYPNAFISTSTCCPSRASLLTGLFADRHRVLDNDRIGTAGGYYAFRRSGNEQRSLGLRLHRAGYVTGMFGKYFNEYGRYFDHQPPPGWDRWRAFTTKHGGAYQGFTASFPKKPTAKKVAGRDHTRLPKRPPPFSEQGTNLTARRIKGYSTTWLGDQAAEFIRDAPRNKPVFAYYAPYAPHAPARPEPKYRNSLSDDLWWAVNPAFEEDDLSDKPTWVRRNHRDNLGGGRYADLAVRQRETLRSVDDQVQHLVSALKATHRWSKTLFVFTSDNGIMSGIHRERSKYVPYRAATEVPLIVRYGHDRHPTTDQRVVAANVDVSATALSVAGLHGPLASMDGVTLLGAPGRAGVPLLGAARDHDAFAARPPYCGWRTADEMYVRYGSGEEEYYDYSTDPYELDNRVTDISVADRVQTLRGLARSSCTKSPPGYGPTFDDPKWTYRSGGSPHRYWSRDGAAWDD